MTTKKGLIVTLALAMALGAATAGAEPLRGLDWKLPEKWARMEGATLIVDVPPDGGRPMVCATAQIDVSRAFREFGVAIIGVRFRAMGVTEPDARWNGVKVMYSYVDADGDTQYVGIDSLKGTFDWRFDTVRLSALATPRGIRDNRVTFFLGLQGCTGHAEFDLSSVDLTIEKSGLLLANQDYIVRYPEGAAEQQIKGAPAAQMKSAATQQMKSAPAAQMMRTSRLKGALSRTERID